VTNQPQPDTRPPFGYWYTHLNPAGQKKAWSHGAKEAGLNFAQQVAFGVKILTKREEDPKKRAELYDRKPINLWVGQRIYFPPMFEDAIRDWERVDDSPEAIAKRANVIAQVEQQASALEQQLALQEAQERAAALNPMPPSGNMDVTETPPAAPLGPEGEAPIGEPLPTEGLPPA
jgi:hypothetical protein